MAYYIVDRIEGEYAYLEDETGKISAFKRNALPSDISEGSCLSKTKDGWRIEPSKETKRKETVKSKFDRIFKRREEI